MKERQGQTVKSCVHCAVTKRIEPLKRCNACKHSFVFEGVTRCGYKTKEKSGLPLER